MNLRLAAAWCVLFSSTGPALSADRADPVVALVAASTVDAVKEAAAEFTTGSGIQVKISPGPSNTLASQIIQGAPAHVFLSASVEWGDKLREERLVEKLQPLLTNQLVLAVPKDAADRIKGLDDLRAGGRRVALAGEFVPAGKYAEQALRALKLFDSLLERKAVVRGQDVRSTLAFVERAEVDAGVVYATDVRVSSKVVAVYTFDPKTHDPIVYPVVLLKSAAGNAAAVKFYDYLRSAAAKKIFERHGFTPLK